jgi:hypothetical protein
MSSDSNSNTLIDFHLILIIDFTEFFFYHYLYFIADLLLFVSVNCEYLERYFLSILEAPCNITKDFFYLNQADLYNFYNFFLTGNYWFYFFQMHHLTCCFKLFLSKFISFVQTIESIIFKHRQCFECCFYLILLCKVDFSFNFLNQTFQFFYLD